MRRLPLLLIAVFCGACLSHPMMENPMGDRGEGGEKPSRCKQQADQTLKVSGGVQAGFQKGLAGMEGQAGFEQVIEIQTRFDDLQRDYAQLTYQLCEDSASGAISQAYYERRRECLDQWLSAMRAMDGLLQKTDKNDPEEVAWGLQSQMQWLEQIVSCGKPAAPTVTPMTVADQPEIELTAYLVCQVQREGKWQSVEDCDNAPLRENDRVKIGFQVNQAARIYIMNYNETGLFQMMFPDPGIANEVEAGREYFLPPGEDDWFELDDQKNVTERFQIIASIEKIPGLEARRGAYIEPKKPGTPPKEALQTRGMVEPFVTRGFKKKKAPVKLNLGGSAAVETVPKVTAGKGISVAEWRLRHE